MMHVVMHPVWDSKGLGVTDSNHAEVFFVVVVVVVGGGGGGGGGLQ